MSFRTQRLIIFLIIYIYILFHIVYFFIIYRQSKETKVGLKSKYMTPVKVNDHT